MQKMTSTAAVAAMALVCSLTLAGCGGPSSTYDFTQINGMEPDSEIGIEFPEELIAMAGPEAENLLVTDLVVRSHELDSGEYCAVDFEISYAEGAVDTLTVPDYTQGEADDAAAAAKESFLRRFEVSSAAELEQQMMSRVHEAADEWARDGKQYVDGEWVPRTIEGYLMDRYDTPKLEVAAAHYLLSLSTEAIGVADQFSSGEAAATVTVPKVVAAVNDEIDQEQQTKVDEAAAEPMADRIAEHLDLGTPQDAAAFDEADLEDGTYFAKDFTTATVVTDCAKSPYDEDTAFGFSFPTLKDDELTRFAEIEFNVMNNGEVTVVSGEIDGYVVDANGDWIAS